MSNKTALVLGALGAATNSASGGAFASLGEQIGAGSMT